MRYPAFQPPNRLVHSTFSYNYCGEKFGNDRRFATEILRQTGVLVVHSSGFDPLYGKDHFRAVLLPEESVLEEAFDAIENLMKRALSAKAKLRDEERLDRGTEQSRS